MGQQPKADLGPASPQVAAKMLRAGSERAGPDLYPCTRSWNTPGG